LNNHHKDLMLLLNKIEIQLILREQVNSQVYRPVLQSHIKNLLRMRKMDNLSQLFFNRMFQ